jgi:hypothetical protein
MLPFLSDAAKQTVSAALASVGVSDARGRAAATASVTARVADGVLTIGDVAFPVTIPRHPELVPQPMFYDIPR